MRSTTIAFLERSAQWISLSLNLLHAWRHPRAVDGPYFAFPAAGRPGHKLATGCHEYSITTYSRRSGRLANGRPSAPNVIRQRRDAIFDVDGEAHVQAAAAGCRRTQCRHCTWSDRRRQIDRNSLLKPHHASSPRPSTIHWPAEWRHAPVWWLIRILNSWPLTTSQIPARKVREFVNCYADRTGFLAVDFCTSILRSKRYTPSTYPQFWRKKVTVAWQLEMKTVWQYVERLWQGDG